VQPGHGQRVCVFGGGSGQFGGLVGEVGVGIERVYWRRASRATVMMTAAVVGAGDVVDERH
jgi:hypothetical protein